MLEHQTIRIKDNDTNTRLDRFLRRHHPSLTQSHLEKLLRNGDIRVDGSKVKSSHRLESGMEISLPKNLPERKRKPTAADPKIVELVKNSVIKRGDGWLILNKPSGLATQGGSGIRHHIDGALGEAFPEFEQCRLVHRLDKDTSGLLVIATNLETAQQLAKGFQNYTHEKTYLALTQGTPKVTSGKITAPLLKAGKHGEEKMQVGDQGHPATTLYRTLEQISDQVAVIALRPKTGRTHQLRAHMAHLRCPILGDRKYGGRDASPNDSVKRLCLHATSIQLAIDGVGPITAPLPDDIKSVFKFFNLDASQAIATAARPDCFDQEGI